MVALVWFMQRLQTVQNPLERMEHYKHHLEEKEMSLPLVCGERKTSQGGNWENTTCIGFQLIPDISHIYVTRTTTDSKNFYGHATIA